jgi:hypothetical protein
MRVMLAFTIGLVLADVVGWQVSLAQEDEYILSHEDVFGSLRRPEVNFSHKIHEESLDDGGCASCHHTPNEKTGRLEYIEGEELTCKECRRPFTEIAPAAIANRLNPATLKAGRPPAADAIKKLWIELGSIHSF